MQLAFYLRRIVYPPSCVIECARVCVCTSFTVNYQWWIVRKRRQRSPPSEKVTFIISAFSSCGIATLTLCSIPWVPLFPISICFFCRPTACLASQHICTVHVLSRHSVAGRLYCRVEECSLGWSPLGKFLSVLFVVHSKRKYRSIGNTPSMVILEIYYH